MFLQAKMKQFVSIMNIKHEIGRRILFKRLTLTYLENTVRLTCRGINVSHIIHFEQACEPLAPVLGVLDKYLLFVI
jgi:hypothetical protein